MSDIFDMNKLKNHILVLLAIMTLIVPSCAQQDNEKSNGNWTLGPFKKVDNANPILKPDSSSTFEDPISHKIVHWEAKDVFNPATVVRHDTLFLLYRAEDYVGKFNGTSRIGLAWSTDGIHFKRKPKPVFYPGNDAMKPYEWEGGIEDPRIVEAPDRTYYMTYTTYDGDVARLAVASSPDLRHWTKHGLAFENVYNGRFKDTWSKSGAILTKRNGQQLIARKIDNKYWMYWGDTNIYAATSTNLTDWKPVLNDDGELKKVIEPRKGNFDSQLVESGPPAMITNEGILLIYNSKNSDENGDPDLPNGTYAAGQVLLDPQNPTEILQRTDSYFIHPEKSYEITGQVNNVCFLEGLAPYKNSWFLYYGTADSRIAVAESPMEK